MPIDAITYDDGAAITPSDSAAQATHGQAFAAFYCGAGGDVALMPARGTVAFKLVAVPGGVIVPVAWLQIMATGTTATSIVGLRAQPYVGK
jgi:hypothetical protein